jgi:drug/metabolite transporter (DMT)-like permease
MALSDNIKGALFMASAMMGFAFSDAITKTLREDMNVGQIMFVRGGFTTLIVFLIAWKLGALRPLRVAFSPVIMARALMEIIAALTFIYALGKIPLANASAILQALPLAVTLGAALFLHEPVGWRRWTAIITGFIGVMIIIRPGPDGFSLASLVCVVCVFAAATRDLLTKSIDPEIPSIFITLVTTMIITVSGAALIVPTGGWKPMSPSIVGLMGLASLAVIVGYQSIVMAMRAGEISFIAPFRYTSLFWSIGLGYFVFGDLPDYWMFIGIIVIVASGLYTFYRENKLRVKALAQRPSEQP